MQINVSQQLKEAIGSTRSYDVDETIDIANLESHVEGRVSLVRTDRGILARGTLRTEIAVTCSRCLRSCTLALKLAVEEEYYPTKDVLTGAPLSLPDQAGCFTLDDHHILDLTEAIRQYAVLATPMKPLCQENCAGLCPTCGHNLNLGPCDCPQQEIDPRWSGLRKLAVADNNA